ncbi:hypothetical protein GALMADRAFT_1137983 [Galerina marginata CBS 339.88]|uniref:Uncharacterized protein n=1 Tax=Galerina marginata (strain CBS 339.88) TaxID=685588 RepID=A0A067S822_GALM3|nr:hypothetical protein GALMADRAFT_1137983 [Galerina marginata CBS 339.88]
MEVTIGYGFKEHRSRYLCSKAEWSSISFTIRRSLQPATNRVRSNPSREMQRVMEKYLKSTTHCPDTADSRMRTGRTSGARLNEK